MNEGDEFAQHNLDGGRVVAERSHGRPYRGSKRSRDLRLVETVGEPSGSRGTGGRFAKGNGIGKNRGIKAQLRRSLGRDATNPVVERLAREMRVLENGLRGDLPSARPSVLLLVQARATWTVLVPHLTTLALDAGVNTEAGRAYLELALKLDARAERLAITSLDLATTLADADTAARGKPSLEQALADVRARRAAAARAAAVETTATPADAPQGQPDATTREGDT